MSTRPATGADAETVASRRALEEIARAGAAHLGYVSLEHGTLAPGPLPVALPPSYAAWDELAMALPALWSDLAVRRAVADLPALSGGADELPDAALWRASVVLGTIAYSYVRCDLHDLHERAPLPIPEHVLAPWTQVAGRMGRQAPHLAYDDIVTVNWRLLDARRPDPLRLENLRLAVPLLGNGAELQFLGGNIEIGAQLAPVVGATVRAQEAVARDDRDALVDELVVILDRLRHVTDVSLAKIDPNAHSGRFADPVVWAKLVAPTGIPVVEGVPGVSGAGASSLQLVDAFLGRRRFETMLGGEALHTRAWYAPNVRSFLDAIEKVSVRDYVAGHDDAQLAGVFASVVNAYAGDRGYLGAHRRKVYGFIQTAFKAGRPATASGISGGFSTRTWRTTIGHLEDARRERYEDLLTRPQIARLAAREAVGDDPAGVTRVTLDVADAGVVYRPGDRLAVAPLNEPQLVERTLLALRARGDEPIALNRAWRMALRARSGEDAPERIALRDFLGLARLRPLEREAAKMLVDLSGAEELTRILEAREEDERELWDAIELAAATGYDPRRLWRAALWQDESLARIVDPARRRMYSIASAPDRSPFAARAALTVGPLRFDSASPGSAATTEGGGRAGLPEGAQAGEDRLAHRRGTGSSYLTTGAQPGSGVDVQIVRPSRFRLPDDPAVPVVMFAGGTGIAPFVGFIEERLASPGAAPCWLFAAARTVAELPYREQLEAHARDGRLRLCTAISREAYAGSAAQRVDAVIEEAGNAADLLTLLAGDGAFYICGQAGFANTVIDALAAVAGPAEQGRTAIRRLVGEGRLMSDLFTTFAPAGAPGVRGSGTYDVSELVLHNDEEHGWWLAINGAVYDMTEFRQLHPGGFRIIDDNAGLDATDEYRAVEHHEDSEIEAMLAMYKIGFMRRYDLGTAWGVALNAKGIRYVSLLDFFTSWVRHLYLVVEMQNALRNDFSFLESALTEVDEAGALTRLKLMLAADLQGRILGVYIPDATGPALNELWEVACGFFDAGADPRALAQRLHALAGGPAGAAASAGTARFRAAVAAGELEPHACSALLDDLRAIDAALLEGIKARLRDGVRAFEMHQSELIDHGDATLLAALTGVVDELDEFYTRLAGVWERHATTGD